MSSSPSSLLSKLRTPAARTVVLTGAIDTIRHRRRRFLLELSDGQKIPGRVDEEFMSAEELRSYWGKKVTVKGIVHFRPSGRVQLLEAHTLAPWTDGDEVFAAMPKAEQNVDLLESPATKSEPFEAIRGTWPGDETIEELLAALRD